MSAFDFTTTPKKVPAVSTIFRKIETDIPAPGTAEMLSRLSLVEARSMQGQLPIVWDRAKDFSVFDIAGNCWIDFTSTIFVTNVGHSNYRVEHALKEQLSSELLSCYAYVNTKRVEYVEKLVTFAGEPFEKAFLMSAGTEATEAAFKLMRLHGQKLNKRRLGIICIEGNWHGRTTGAQMLSSNEVQKSWIGYQDPDIHYIPFPYPWDSNNANGEDFFMRGLQELKSKGLALETDICGFMLETFQGWGAVFYPKDFVASLCEFSKKIGALVTFDEMQSGFARTGEKFGYLHYGVTPDLICIGKAMGNGLPVSGVLGQGQVLDLPEVGNMSSTHSANPLVCAAGLAVIEEIEEHNLVSETQRKGKILHAELLSLQQKFPKQIQCIQGKGLVAALIFKREFGHNLVSMVVQLAMQKGLLLVHTGRESIKIGPPLTILDDAIVEGVSVLNEAISEVVDKCQLH